jgi:hypothetical protein
MTFFQVADLRPPGPDDKAVHQDEDESIEVAPFTIDEIRAQIISGEIVDLKTVAGIWMLGN